MNKNKHKQITDTMDRCDMNSFNFIVVTQKGRLSVVGKIPHTYVPLELCGDQIRSVTER